jgi:hypothetical protein
MRLLDRRRNLIAKAMSGFAKYQFVEYIESTGTQWIDTGVVANGDTKVDIDFQLTKTSGFLFGSRVSVSKDAYTLNVTSAGNLVSLYGVGTDGYGGAYTLCKADTKRHIVNKNQNYLYIDGNYITPFPKQTFTTPANLELFACYNNGTKGHSPAQMKLYSCQIFDGVTEGSRTPLRDFRPCYRTSDKKPGLYDILNDVFYENQGSGEFILGPNV